MKHPLFQFPQPVKAKLSYTISGVLNSNMYGVYGPLNNNSKNDDDNNNNNNNNDNNNPFIY